MTTDTYNSLSDKEKAIVDGLVMIFKEQQKTNVLLELILKNE